MSIDGFTGGGGGGLNPSPQMPAPIPRKSSHPPEKYPTPQVESQFHELKVHEGVSEHKNSLFSTNIFGGLRIGTCIHYMYYNYIQGFTIIQWGGCVDFTSPKVL